MLYVIMEHHRKSWVLSRVWTPIGHQKIEHVDIVKRPQENRHSGIWSPYLFSCSHHIQVTQNGTKKNLLH